MNEPEIARWIRRLGFRIAKLAKYFLSESDDYREEQEFLRKLYRSARWTAALDKLTDRELVRVIGDHRAFQFDFDTEEDCIATEIVVRLQRANGGHTDYDLTESADSSPRTP